MSTVLITQVKERNWQELESDWSDLASEVTVAMIPEICMLKMLN